jgi:hypothetical protein
MTDTPLQQARVMVYGWMKCPAEHANTRTTECGCVEAMMLLESAIRADERRRVKGHLPPEPSMRTP